MFLANRVGGASGRKPLYLWPWHTHLVVQATLTRRQWLLRQEAHLGGASVHGWRSSRCVFPCSSSKQAKADTVEHANQVDRLALSGPNGVCKHASMQRQTSCQRLGSSSGYRQQRQHFVFHAKQMWKPSGSPKSSVVQTTNPF